MLLSFELNKNNHFLMSLSLGLQKQSFSYVAKFSYSPAFNCVGLGSRLGCQKWLGRDLEEKMFRMSSDELLLRRFGQPSGMPKVA